MEPEDYPDKREALVNDFRNYLSILKAVHSGADLTASAQVWPLLCSLSAVQTVPMCSPIAHSASRAMTGSSAEANQHW